MTEWISVEERLPEPGERVLVTNGSFVCEAYLNIINKWVRAGKQVFFMSPSSWMPLPEPPGEEVTLAAPKVDAVQVVRCKDCAVPHNKWTGCPKMNGTIMPPDGFCSYGERRADHAAQKEKPHAGTD